jgi:hypothetical protein
MFTTTTEDERVFALKPMNCPGAVSLFAQGIKSYRDLPLRMAEFGKVHRYEPSGALHGLLRVRHFTQDDAHIFCTPAQMQDECARSIALVFAIYRDFGFDEVAVKLSTRPARRMATTPPGTPWRMPCRAPLNGWASPTGSTPAKAPSTAPSWSSCCVTPSAATGSAAPCRWT